MEWLQILVDENKKVQAQLAELQADQKKLLSLGLDSHYRSKKNEATLERNTADMAEHVRRTNDLQVHVEEMGQIFKWFSITGRMFKWVGGIAAAVTATWGLYKITKGL